jgi:hypothetical protein
MDKYFLKLILLKECFYSKAAHKLSQTYKLPVEINWINQTNKENYKTEQINTFPQIYLKKKNSNGSLLLGGYQELENCINIFYGHEISEQNINNFMNKTKWSKKSSLRLIQLINNIN